MRRILLAAACAAAAFSATPHAEAAPPYCVVVSESGNSVVSACAIGTGCAVYGNIGNGIYCIFWP